MRLISTLFILFTFSIYASTPVEVLTPINNIFAPKGFDSNDNTEIVVTGYLPNLCHKSPKTKVRFDSKSIYITISSLKYSESNPFCAEMLVPFLKTIDLGVLDKGTYDIIVNNKSIYERNDKLNIANRTGGIIDEYIYPAIEYVEKDYRSRTLKIKGYNPSDCFVLDRIEVTSNEEDTYSVLPVLKKVSEYCALKLTPFTYEMEVPKGIDRDIVLLHIRSMHGNSYNTLYNSSFE